MASEHLPKEESATKPDLPKEGGLESNAGLTMSVAKLLSHVKAEHGGTDPKFVRYSAEKHKGRDWLEISAGSNSQQPQVNAALDKAIVYDDRLIRKTAETEVIRYRESLKAGDETDNRTAPNLHPA